MAAISYSTTSPFGSKVYLAVQSIRGAQATFQRVKQAADAVSGGGVTPANLETSPLFMVSTGQGAAFYAAIQSIDAALFTTPGSWTPVQATIDLDQG
jgi:hypothetical protein